MMGFNPMNIGYICLANEAGLGVGDSMEIDPGLEVDVKEVFS